MRALPIALVLSLTCSAIVSAQSPPTLNAPRAILTYPAVNKTLYSKSPDEQALQGSLAKLMTGYVALWAVNQKIVSLDDPVTISPRDTMQGCSCMKPATNVTRTLCTGQTVTGNFPQTQAGEVFKFRSGQLAGNGKAVRVLSLSNDRLLTVVRENSGALRLATWTVSANGKFTQLNTTSATGQTAEELSVAAARRPTVLGGGAAPFQVVTATTQQSGSIRLHSWSVNASTGVITFQKTSQAVDLSEQVRNISVAASGAGKFATAATIGTGTTGTHEIVFWSVGGDGSFTRTFASTQGNETAAGTAIAPLGPSAPYAILGPNPSAFVTAAIVNGALKVVTWDLPRFLNEGNTADYRIADSGSSGGAGAAVRIAKIRGTTPPAEKYVTAMKQADGTLLLIGWGLGQQN